MTNHPNRARMTPPETHTPGPWHTHEDVVENGVGVLDADCRAVAIAFRHCDARLIAAAPELVAIVNRVAFEPIGDAEASYRDVLSQLTVEARALLVRIREADHA